MLRGTCSIFNLALDRTMAGLLKKNIKYNVPQIMISIVFLVVVDLLLHVEGEAEVVEVLRLLLQTGMYISKDIHNIEPPPLARIPSFPFFFLFPSLFTSFSLFLGGGDY